MVDPVIITALISALVSFAVAFAITYFNRSFQKKQNTFELLKLFISKEMLDTRTQVLNIFKENLSGINDNLSVKELREKISEDQWMHFSQLSHFFVEIYLLHKNKVTNKKMSKDLFIRYFKKYDQYYSKIISADEDLPLEEQWSLIKRIKQLKTEWKL